MPRKCYELSDLIGFRVPTVCVNNAHFNSRSSPFLNQRKSEVKKVLQEIMLDIGKEGED